MKRKKSRAACIFVIIFTFGISSVLTGCNKGGISENLGGNGRKEPLSRSEFLLDTTVSISIYDHTDETVLDDAFSEIKRLETLLSIDQEGSDLDKLYQNAGKDWTRVSPETLEVFQASKQYSELTGGVFDVTAGPLISLWNIRDGKGHYPTAMELAEVQPFINYQNVAVEGNQMMLKTSGMKMNYGAIAKGYVADCIKKLLQEKGVKNAVINLGGNILTVGNKPEGTPFIVGIQDPLGETGAYLGTVESRDKSLVSSGDYERFFMYEGKRYHHILNPFTGFPSENELCGVTVISTNSIDGDAMSTSVFLLGLEGGRKLIEKVDGLEAIFVTKDKRIYMTSGVKEIFQLTNNAYKLEEK